MGHCDFRILLCVFAFFLPTARGYGTGPPVDTADGLCNSMFPAHNADASTDTVPYEILLEKTGQDVNVTVKVKSGHEAKKIKGLFVQARTVDPKPQMNSYGTFKVSDTKLQTLDCFNGKDNSVGHRDPVDADSRSFTWSAPKNLTEKIHFVATVVHARAEFWVNITSETVEPEPEPASKPEPVDPGNTGAISGPSTVTTSMVILVLMLLRN